MIPDTFPDLRVYDAYMNPLTSSNCEQFTFGIPNIEKIRHFMMEKAGWSKIKTDQILMPVIKEIKKHNGQSVQPTIDSFFPKLNSASIRGSHNSKRVEELLKGWK